MRKGKDILQTENILSRKSVLWHSFNSIWLLAVNLSNFYFIKLDFTFNEIIFTHILTFQGRNHEQIQEEYERKYLLKLMTNPEINMTSFIRFSLF